MGRRHARSRSLVLQVVTDTDRRGAQVFASELGEWLQQAGLSVTTVALTAGSRGAQLDLARLGPARLHPRTLWALRKLMRRAAIVVAHGSSTLAAVSMAGVGMSTPVIYRNISDPAYWWSTPGRRARVRPMLSRVQAVVSLWPAGGRYVVDQMRVSAARVHIIPNGVSVDRFRPPTPAERRLAREQLNLPADAPVLLFVAALQPEKHPITAVDALQHLGEDVHLLVLGDGPEMDKVTELAARIGRGRVRILGQVSDPLPAYWSADVFILPTEGEGLPAVLIEAGLCGLPAVASNSGGCADIVLDGASGRIIPPAEPRALAAAVQEALRHRQVWGAQAHEHCLLTYDMRVVGEQWAELIESVRA
jgi:glycosyltransferase involved in cell wall biosynthesis